MGWPFLVAQPGSLSSFVRTASVVGARGAQRLCRPSSCTSLCPSSCPSSCPRDRSPTRKASVLSCVSDCRCGASALPTCSPPIFVLVFVSVFNPVFMPFVMPVFFPIVMPVFRPSRPQFMPERSTRNAHALSRVTVCRYVQRSALFRSPSQSYLVVHREARLFVATLQSRQRMGPLSTSSASWRHAPLLVRVHGLRLRPLGLWGVLVVHWAVAEAGTRPA